MSKSKTKILLVTLSITKVLCIMNSSHKGKQLINTEFTPFTGINTEKKNDRKSGSRANGCFITITPQHTELFPWHDIDFSLGSSLSSLPPKRHTYFSLDSSVSIDVSNQDYILL
ncbi:hypothetical protein LAZ67_16001004 [Cordylochernes scorpioides]|uniref:Uncharacterized protein n=1 Tax=Cordylochernes scorpioides TaxID=51811 RepID=A0ABY6LDK4_9ARAC|nr:hypothetical protein LAZ67_16001004 [Cordylochernes scorpioides]